MSVAEQSFRAGDQNHIFARSVDGLAGGADAFHRVGKIEEIVRPVKLAVLDGKSRNACLDGQDDAGCHSIGLSGEAGLEIGVYRDVDGGTQGRQMPKDVLARHGVVGAAGCPGIARAG